MEPRNADSLKYGHLDKQDTISRSQTSYFERFQPLNKGHLDYLDTSGGSRWCPHFGVPLYTKQVTLTAIHCNCLVPDIKHVHVQTGNPLTPLHYANKPTTRDLNSRQHDQLHTGIKGFVSEEVPAPLPLLTLTSWAFHTTDTMPHTTSARR